MTEPSTRYIDRRNMLKYAGAAGAASIAGCLGGGDDGQPYYPHTIWGMFGSWEDAYVRSGEFYAEDHSFEFENRNSRDEEEEQISHIQSFIQQDADGIAVGPVSSTAPADAVEEAADEGIPVIACNSGIETSELSMAVYIGNEPACEQVANEIVDELGGEGTVVNLQGDLGMSIGRSREQGFQNAVEGEDGIEVLEARANFVQEEAQENTFSLLQSEDGEIDAIFAANGGMAAGAAQALGDYDMEPGDVFLGTMDGSPTVIDLIDQGWAQRGFSQPTQYYLPIALYYLEQIRAEGDDSLPEPGDEVTTDDLEITGEEHMGADIWAGQDWAPASIKEVNGHTWFQTNGRLLTPDNYDEESNWGVVFADE